jgi:hypothetical protein
VSQPLREAFKLKREMNAVCGGISRYSANVTLLEVGMRLEGAASVLMARVGLRRSEYLSPAEREFSHRRRSTLGFYRHIIETNVFLREILVNLRDGFSSRFHYSIAPADGESTMWSFVILKSQRQIRRARIFSSGASTWFAGREKDGAR